MLDLAEVRRFWPWMRPPHVDYTGHADYQCRRRGVHYLAHQHQAQWWVSVVNWHCRPWSEVFVDHDGYRIGGGDTVAEAMAAAGFGVRPKGWRAIDRKGRTEASRAWQKGPWSDYCRVPPQSRQRPRKGVRLGKRGRRLALAASLGEARELVAQAAKGRRG